MAKRHVLILNYAILLIYAIVLTITSPLLVEIAKSYTLNMVQTGSVLSAYFTGVVVFILIGGALADKYGKKRLLVICSFGLSAALFLLPISPDYLSICIIMALVGGFGGTIETIVSALITEFNPENPGFYLNLAHVFFGFAAIAAPISIGFLISAGTSWRMCYYFLALLTLLVSLILSAVKFPELIRKKDNNWKSIKSIICNREFLLICLCMFFYTGTELGSWGWMSVFLKENAHFSLIKSSIAVGVFWLFITIGRLICGLLTFRINIRKIIITLAVLSAAVTFLSGVVSNEFFIWIIIAALGLTYSSQWPLIVSYGGSKFNTTSGIIFALMVASGGLGSMIVPYGMGIIGQYISIRAAMMSPSVLVLSIAIIFIGFGKKQEVIDKP